ncbi:MAG: DUF3592 domain-containing protein [Luteolibacter sp.]
MVSWIILIISLILLVVGVATGVGTFSWLRDARTAEGTVIELVENKSSSRKKGKKSTFAPRVSYQIDGQDRDFVSSQSSNPPDFKIGEKVRVATNLQRDKESIATFGELYGFSVGATFIGLAMAGTVVALMNGDKLLRVFHPHLG